MNTGSGSTRLESNHNYTTDFYTTKLNYEIAPLQRLVIGLKFCFVSFQFYSRRYDTVERNSYNKIRCINKRAHGIVCTKRIQGETLYANDPVGPCSNPRISFHFCQEIKIIAYAIQWTKWIKKLGVLKIVIIQIANGLIHQNILKPQTTPIFQGFCWEVFLLFKKMIKIKMLKTINNALYSYITSELIIY